MGLGESDLVTNVMRLAAQGFSRSEIAGVLGEDPGRVGRALSKLRKLTRGWSETRGF